MAAPLLAAIPAIIDMVGRFLPEDPKKKAEAEFELQKRLLEISAQENQAQSEINREEAKSGSLFIGGWRPAIGWVCAFALGFNYIARPIWIWAVQTWYPQASIPPGLDGMLWELVLAMLGFGGLRSIEKAKGCAR